VLYLSLAANHNHPLLRPIQHRLTHIPFAQHGGYDQSARLAWIHHVLEDEQLLRQTERLLRFADLGIAELQIHTRTITEDDLAVIDRMILAVRDTTSTKPGGAPTSAEIATRVNKELRFAHRSRHVDEHAVLRAKDESSGTLAWLSLVVPALFCLRYGDTFLVDEIDSSLHPRLTAALIQIFKDPETNKSGAQLIFTSHDVSLLGQLTGSSLRADEIWLTEKNSFGESELFSLQDFPVRHNDNFERRYLHGRYGAVPFVEPQELRIALSDGIGKG
jgi:hypothetical protein